MNNLADKQTGRLGMEALLEIARIVQEQLQADGKIPGAWENSGDIISVSRKSLSITHGGN
ncbi:MAG: hypothetical protein KAT62_07340 [Desulfuromonadales bacterium]|nr:hypothetical protein [Desulfuromonadales bacterium]